MQLALRGHPNSPLALLGTDGVPGRGDGGLRTQQGSRDRNCPPKGGLGRGIRPLRTGHPRLLQDPHKVREVP